MSALFLLIAVSLVMALGFLAAFVWAVRADQYDDPESPAMRMLFNGPRPSGESKASIGIEKSDEPSL